MAASDDNEYFLIAPAKVNLILDVEAELVEGRHPVKTIMQAISLCDHLHVKVDRESEEPGIKIAVVDAHGLAPMDLAPEDNLVYRAIVAYHEAMGEPLRYRFDVTLEKSIPPQSGLGGGSSDCAAAIALMARVFGHDPEGELALSVACSLGTDIAFFLHGGTVLLDGYGERHVETLPAPELEMVVARPGAGLGTGTVYRTYDELNARCGADELRDGSEAMNAHLTALAEALRMGGEPHEVASHIGNSLQEAAFGLAPEVARAKELLGAQPGVLSALLSGSGSAVFALCEDEESAQAASAAMEAAGLWSVTCRSVSFGAGVGDSL